MMIPVAILAIESDSDRAYMTHLYGQHRALMLKTAWEFSRNRADVEDIVSNSCMALIEHIDTIRDMERNVLRAYIVRTVRNKAIDFCRKQQRTNARFIQVDDEVTERIAASESIETKILLKDQISRVMTALKELPERERDILRLKYQKELTNKEIAEIMGIAESSVRKYIERARKYLKASIY